MDEDEDAEPGPPGMPISEATRRLLHARGLDSSVVLGEIMAAWDDVVGEQVARHARPRALHGPALVVEVDDPAWATQLQFLAGSILGGLQGRFGRRSPTELSVRVGRRRAGGDRSPR